MKNVIYSRFYKRPFTLNQNWLNPMQTSITSNRRRLSRALYALLIAIAAVWAMPNVRAQIYVASLYDDGFISEYNLTTGKLINLNFIADEGVGLLAIDGNNLFVANRHHDAVSKFNVRTGTGIYPFISTNDSTGGVALSGNTVYVTVDGTPFPGDLGSRIGTYNAKTGAPINPTFITGLGLPEGIAIRGNTLFVVDQGNNSIGKYNAATGGAINANFITALNIPWGIAVSDDNLFVTNYVGGTVGKYDARTGGAINPGFITGLDYPVGIAVLGNTLYVTNGGGVSTYNATTGAVIKVNFIAGIGEPEFGIAVKGAK